MACEEEKGGACLAAAEGGSTERAGGVLWGECVGEGPGEAWLIGAVEEWAARQVGADRSWIVARPQYGLGNRIVSAVSIMALAIASDRRLYLDWGEPFEGLLEPPPGMASAGGGWGRPPRGRAGASMDLSAHSGSFGAAARGVACGGAGGTGEDAMGTVWDPAVWGVEVRSDQYFLPLVLMSRLGEGAMCPRGECGRGWADVAFRVLGRWLVRPSGRVREAVLGWEAHWGRSLVGVHVRTRMYGWEAAQVPLVESDVSLRCAKRLWAVNSNGSEVGVFVAATSPGVHEEAGRVLGGVARGTRGATERLAKGGDGERQAMMDLVILSRACGGIVASVHSTFGYAAHGLAGVAPWVVTSATSATAAKRAEQGVQGRSKCVRAEGYGPCFHGWESVREHLGECYDEARHMAYAPRPCWY